LHGVEREHGHTLAKDIDANIEKIAMLPEHKGTQQSIKKITIIHQKTFGFTQRIAVIHQKGAPPHSRIFFPDPAVVFLSSLFIGRNSPDLNARATTRALASVQ
jgi:hypothetical protein